MEEKTNIDTPQNLPETQDEEVNRYDFQRLPLSDGPERSVISQYLNSDHVPAEVVDEILQRLEDSIIDEAYSCHDAMNRRMIEQSAYLDIGFRFFFGGGEDRKISERDFIIAMKAQDQSLRALRESRQNVRSKKTDQIDFEQHNAKMQDRLLKNRETITRIRENEERNRRFD